MKSSTARCHSFWLGCLFATLICGLARADGSGEITGVRLAPDGKSIVIEVKGKVGKHRARVLGQPNRLMVDFSGMQLAKVPPKIAAGRNDIHAIRVGNSGTKVRVVVDFRDRPVPAFTVEREENRVVVGLGRSVASAQSSQEAPPVQEPLKKPLETPVPLADFVGAAVQSPAAPPDRQKNQESWQSAATSAEGAAKQKSDLKGTKLAQVMEQPSPAPPSDRNGIPAAPGPGPRSGGVSVSSQVGPQPTRMVREVRPPVTPPTPDPRLLVQEITELRFLQVGHNARLMIRGGDHLDYRMTKESPTKLRLDLINAEIPKAHQKPLQTDLFSTSVEMIIPGSQTIFIQLKDAVPYQVQKQKGVLMIDFPAPRFAMTSNLRDLGENSDIEGARVIRQEQVRGMIEEIRKQIKGYQDVADKLKQQRADVIKSYQITPDPEIFSKPVTMDFQGIQLKNAFRLLAEQASINVIVDPDIGQQTTTLRLFEVPLGQVVDTILNSAQPPLSRVMMGNVMRVGREGAIKRFRDDRQKEFNQRIKQIEDQIAGNGKEAETREGLVRQYLGDLERMEKEAVPTIDDTKTEEVGEAGCIDVEGEKVCFSYTTVRVTYAIASQIVNILDCMFRLQCRGARGVGLERVGVETQAEQDVARAQALGQAGAVDRAAYQQYLADQGFQPGSPGSTARMQGYDSIQSQVLQSQAQQTIGAGVAARSLRGGAGGPRVDLPFGEDPKLARIIAYSRLWADDTNRLIFIKDTPERTAQMKRMILTLDVPIPQVLMEARLVQADRAWGRSLGVIWGGRNDQSGGLNSFKKQIFGTTGIAGTAGTPTSGIAAPPQPEGTLIPSQFSVNLPAPAVPNLDNLVGLGLQFGLIGTNYITDLDLRISLGEANNMAKVISRPKVQVIDGQSASIKTGQTIAYSTVSAQGTQTQLVNVDLLLNVTPRIYADGRVRMVIRISDNDVGPIVNLQASILTREASTIMIVKDGETAVIGGILRKNENSRRGGWPALMNVPIINAFFSNTERGNRIQELLVFITPTIIRRPPPAA